MNAGDQVRSDVALLYRRAGFGARPDELDAAVEAGYEATVDQLLTPRPDPGVDGVADPVLTLPSASDLKDPTQRRQAVSAARAEEPDLVTWWLRRMTLAASPFPEKATLFWHGHFATAIMKVQLPALMYRQNQLFRTMGTGAFDALTLAAARDPAMLIWLDAASDHKADPNENFGRELMELFTLGLGNYTEDDVKAAARAFTGWRLDPGTWQFALVARDHDNSAKSFLGTTGNLTGEDVITIATHHPASARWVVSRVWSHFAYPVTPAAPLLDDLVAAYGGGLDLAALFRAVFMHPEFRAASSRAGLVKQPIEYVVGALRALAPHTMLPGARPDLSGPARAVLTALGQVPFDPPNVGGWPQNAYWLTTASALARLRFAVLLSRAADLSGLAAQAPADRPAYAARLLGIDRWSPTTAAVLSDAAEVPASLMTLALVSPEYVVN
ncbi:MAG TPA: DUF1800 domain-containing protein [Acidimicrobiales bacterium]|nr:DUF1800 domain-containing protein [Acidimicrobiales bacterium]